jgi:hypothetical protein
VIDGPTMDVADQKIFASQRYASPARDEQSDALIGGVKAKGIS